MTQHDMNAIVAKATAYLRKEQYLAAANAFNVLYDRTQDPKAAHDLAYCYNLAGKLTDAEKWFRKAESLWHRPLPPADSMETVRCPLCNSAKFQRVWVGNTAEAYPEVYGIFDQIKIWVKCSRCHLVYANPRPTKQALERYYSAFYASKNGIESQVQAEEAYDRLMYCEQIINAVEECRGGEVGTLLEVGSGVGFQLAVASYRGWKVTGMELDADTARFCKRTFGCDVFSADLESHTFSRDDQYDVVVMSEVLEHLFSPASSIQKLVGVLAPGGVLLLSTPDLSHPFHILFQQADPMWAVASHLTYWSREGIENLLESTGLTIVKTSFSPVYRGSQYFYAKRGGN